MENQAKPKMFSEAVFLDAFIEKLKQANNGNLGTPNAISQLRLVMDVIESIEGIRFKEGVAEELPLTAEGMLMRRKQLDYTIKKVSTESKVSENAIRRIELGEEVVHGSFVKLLTYYNRKGV